MLDGGRASAAGTVSGQRRRECESCAQQIWWLVFKETRIALLLGTIYGGALVAAAVWVLKIPTRLGIVVGVSLLVTMLLGATIGSMLPVLFEKMRIDPAVATGPFVTTSVDILGILTFFTLASFFGFKS